MQNISMANWVCIPIKVVDSQGYEVNDHSMILSDFLPQQSWQAELVMRNLNLQVTDLLLVYRNIDVIFTWGWVLLHTAGRGECSPENGVWVCATLKTPLSCFLSSFRPHPIWRFFCSSRPPFQKYFEIFSF